jgi:Rieske Fe-S protein
MNTPTPDRQKVPAVEQESRRNFLEWLGKFSIFAGFAGIFASTWRFMLPNVLYEPPTIFTIGKADDFPPNSVTFLEDNRLFIFRYPEGMYAVSSVCSHLGCNVRWSEERTGFDCPCHGSSFDRNGKNIAGPAPRPLKWYELSLVSDNKLQINTRRQVDKDYRLQV